MELPDFFSKLDVYDVIELKTQIENINVHVRISFLHGQKLRLVIYIPYVENNVRKMYELYYVKIMINDELESHLRYLYDHLTFYNGKLLLPHQKECLLYFQSIFKLSSRDTCYVCYEEKPNDPFGLPCGHHLCFLCFMNIFFNSDNSSVENQKERRLLICGICRQRAYVAESNCLMLYESKFTCYQEEL